jgi:hypothetical protein
VLLNGEREHTVDIVWQARGVAVPAERDRVPDADHGIAVPLDDEELVLGRDLVDVGPEFVHGRVVRHELRPGRGDGVGPAIVEVRSIHVGDQLQLRHSPASRERIASIRAPASASGRLLTMPVSMTPDPNSATLKGD